MKSAFVSFSVFASASRRMLFNSRARIEFAVVRAVALLLGLSAALLAGGQTAHYFSGRTTIGSGFSEPLHLAVDTSGDLFVSDAENIAIYEVVAVNGAIPQSPTIRTLYRPSANPQGITVDAQGNVYFTTLDVYSNLGNNSVTELVAVNGVIPASPVARQLGSGLYYPDSVAVDQYGDVFVSDSDHSLVKEFVAVNGSVPASPTILTLGSGFSDPRGIAVDPSGDVYVSDSGNQKVKEILAVNGVIPASPTIETLGSGFCSPWDLALDSAGGLYVADYCNAAIFELPPVNGALQAETTSVEVAGGLSGVEGVAVSPSGTVYAGIVSTQIPALIPAASSFESMNIGSTSGVLPQTFVFDTGGVLGPVSVVTQGAPGEDFQNAGTGSCTAGVTYSAGESCTVNVFFAPTLPGPRQGAAVLEDGNGDAIATGYLSGTGVGPQVNFLPGAQSTMGSSFDFAAGVAVDGSGNAYVVDVINNLGNVQEVMAVNGHIPVSPSIRTLVGGLDCPAGPALDAAGDIYYVDACYHTVNEIQAVNGSAPTSPTVRTLTSQFAEPVGIAVDGNGNVYVLDASNNTVNEILAVNGRIPASPAITTLASGFKELDGIAVDPNGNVYVSDDTSHEVFEIHAVSGILPPSPVITPLGSGFVTPRGIAVDASGNVYVAEYFYDTVYKIVAVNGSIPASPTIQTLGAGLQYPSGVAADGGGNVLVADYGDARLVRLDYADPPSLTFANTAVGSASSDSPQTVTVQNIGNAVLTFPVPSTGANPSIGTDFSLNNNAPNACPLISGGSSTGGTVAAGASCSLAISFAPATAGSLNESLALTDDNLNTASPSYSTQSIQLTGTAVPATPMIAWPTPAPIGYGTPLNAAQLDATANVAGTFAYNYAPGTILPIGTTVLTATFTPTDTTDYKPATASVVLTVTQGTPAVTWATPGPISYGTKLSATQLDTTANVSGTFKYSPASGALLTAGLQTLAVTFTPSDNTHYTTATTSVVLKVNQATPVITWATPAPVTHGTALGSKQLNAKASVGGAFTYSPASGTVLNVGPQTLTTTFTPNDTIDYTNATASVSLTVNPAPTFTISASPASVSVTQGGSTTSIISVSPANGFSGSVKLTTSGLPNGVAASYSSNPTVSTSVLTLKATARATTGTVTLTVTGTSGSLVQMVSVPVAVGP